MAKPKPTSPPASPLASALHSPGGREWIAVRLAAAEIELREGPGGSWVNNEALRPAIEERTEFLRALVALLPK